MATHLAVIMIIFQLMFLASSDKDDEAPENVWSFALVITNILVIYADKSEKPWGYSVYLVTEVN